MSLVCFEIEGWESEKLHELCRNQPMAMTHETLTRNTVEKYAHATMLSCFIYSDLHREVLEKLPHLKLIATRSTGTDHVDLAYCAQHGITVCNVPSYGEHTVAEHVFALLLSLSRHIPLAVFRTRQGDFSFRGLRGFDLYGKTFGVIGTGLIGRHAARIAKGFGMNVIGYDVHPRKDLDFPCVSIGRLLEESDIISLHVPSTAQTHHLLSENEFAAMKDGVVIINTARGPLIDVKALLRALQSGKVAGAGLDVLPEEPTIREEAELLRERFSDRHDLETLLLDHALLHHKNVIVTPHSAFYTREAVEKILQTTAENIHGYVHAQPVNTVAGK